MNEGVFVERGQAHGHPAFCLVESLRLVDIVDEHQQIYQMGRRRSNIPSMAMILLDWTTETTFRSQQSKPQLETLPKSQTKNIHDIVVFQEEQCVSGHRAALWRETEHREGLEDEGRVEMGVEEQIVHGLFYPANCTSNIVTEVPL